VDNFGRAGTRRLLVKMGIGEPPTVLVERALRRIDVAKAEGDYRLETWGLIHKRVFCYAEYDVILDSGEPVRGTLLRENGIRVGHAPPPQWLRSFPTPINSMIGRDLCGEFQLMGGVGTLLDAARTNRWSGVISLYSSATPCASCVAALRQFQVRFPELQVLFVNGETQ